MAEGKYIYSIISTTQINADQDADKRRSISVNRRNNLRESALRGINNQEVKLIVYKDIAAAVSDTEVLNFDRFDKEELTKYVSVHQKVNEELIKAGNVIPMTFGIVAPSDSEVLSILERAYLQFKTALKRMEGKVEFAVQIFWDEKKILEELVISNPEIQKLKKQSLLKGKILSLPIKLKLGKLIFQELDATRRSYLEDVKATLSSRNLNNSNSDSPQPSVGRLDQIGSEPRRPSPDSYRGCPKGDSARAKRVPIWNVLSDDFTSNKLIDKEMIANFSFLIEKAKESELDRKMQELGKKYENKLRFKYIGPMPAYSFVDINLGLGNFELINKARKILRLPGQASFEEIKKAYYSLSHQYHPDKHPDKAEEMKKITQAFEILENYCQSCDEFGEKVANRKCSFKEKDVKNTLIVR